MKTSLDHLRAVKRRDLGRIVEVLHDEFDDALALATSARKKAGRIYKIILFGSYARGDWIDEPHTAKGYRSDYDILVIVNQHKLTDSEYWYKAEDRLLRDTNIKPVVNIIVHTLQDVNSKLAGGRYFFSDIAKEGIALYELKGHKLGTPKPPTLQAAMEMAEEYFEGGLPRAQSFFEGAVIFSKKPEPQHQNHAAFELHQAAEHTYRTLLLTLTLYAPAGHNIEFLRGWPRADCPA